MPCLETQLRPLYGHDYGHLAAMIRDSGQQPPKGTVLAVITPRTTATTTAIPTAAKAGIGPATPGAFAARRKWHSQTPCQVTWQGSKQKRARARPAGSLADVNQRRSGVLYMGSRA